MLFSLTCTFPAYLPIFTHSVFLPFSYITSLSTSSLLQHPLFSSTAFIMISIHLDPRRLSWASLQKFYVIKTHLKHIVIVLGSTGNAYLISIKPSIILCNCPDKVRSCKHVIFIVSACFCLLAQLC